MSIFSCFQTCQPINQNSYIGQLKMRGATLNIFYNINCQGGISKSLFETFYIGRMCIKLG